MNSIPKKIINFPPQYCNAFPSLQFLQWNKDFTYYDSFVTPSINKTQQGIDFIYDSIHYWTCKPSIRPHVQLDTSTIISDKQKIIGTWRTVQNRNIHFIDSATFIDSSIRRKAFLINENNDDDIILTISDKKYTIYFKDRSSNKFKKILNTNYSIENKRYLMLYKFTKCCPGL